MNINVSGRKLHDVVQQCRDLESRGYECIHRITREYTTTKTFHHKNGTRTKFDKTDFDHMEDQVRFRAVYRKTITT